MGPAQSLVIVRDGSETKEEKIKKPPKYNPKPSDSPGVFLTPYVSQLLSFPSDVK